MMLRNNCCSLTAIESNSVCIITVNSLELKRIMSIFTPSGMIALYLGVPTFLVSAVIFLISVRIEVGFHSGIQLTLN